MKIDRLSNTNIDKIIDCFLVAFENYFVKMPTERDYYIQRWKAAKVDFNLSYGMFDNSNLVAFVIHAVDKRHQKQIAFNTGTGVVPEYRGQRLVKSMYDFILPDLKENGIVQTRLEVITKNHIAIRAYESIGFQKEIHYKCYAGDINIEKQNDYSIKEFPLEKVTWNELGRQEYYSWDFSAETLKHGKYTFHEVWHEDERESYFLLNPENKYLAQFDLFKNKPNSYKRLFSAIQSISKTIKVINVDDRLIDKIKELENIGLENTLDQYEMSLNIN